MANKKKSREAPGPEDYGPAVVILAAGLGKRMKSSKPKVLHEILGRPILAYPIHASQYLDPVKICVVVGHGASEVEKVAGGLKGVVFARQSAPLGTGHAILATKELLLSHKGMVLILPGDAPLISPQTLLDFLAAHKALGSDLSVLTVEMEDPMAYGRIIRDSSGWLDRIVEYKDANPEERLIPEINAGIYATGASLLFSALRAIKPENAQGEYYLTDIVEFCRKRGALCSAILSPDPQEVMGVNDRTDLYRCQEVLRLKILESWLKAGVTMEDPWTVTIETPVKLERDVTLGPGVILRGATKVGEGATIGPYAVVSDSSIGKGAIIPPHAVLRDALIPDGARVAARGEEIRGVSPRIGMRLREPPQRLPQRKP
jgi:bifunctional UDP-N-acetylglucosamine pyrophosphorylase/glucosamine-1-phosphate N-acetyltransferase